MEQGDLSDHPDSMGSATFPQQQSSDESANNAVSWFTHPMELPTITSVGDIQRNPYNIQPVNVNLNPLQSGILNYTELRNNMDHEVAIQDYSDSNSFIVNHLKIHEYIKSLNETISGWNLEDVSSQVGNICDGVPPRCVDNTIEVDPTPTHDNLSDITELVIQNIDKIDFNKVGCHMKNTLREYQNEIDSLMKKYKTQNALLESLDSYNSKTMMDLISIKVDTTEKFSKILSEHINNIISKDVVRETQIEMLNKIKEFLNVYEKFKVFKDIDENTGQCVLCMDRPVDITFLPCYHCCCSHCHSLFHLTNKCPMCRSVISSHHKIFI